MEVLGYLQIALVCVLGAVSPGPSLAVIINNTIVGGRFQGMMAAVGHGIGVGIYASIAIAGLGLIITKPEILLIANWVGAAFLGYMGIKAWVNSGKPINTKLEENFRGSLGFSQGFVIVFINPKIAVFFMALFSQFIQPDVLWGEGGLIALMAGSIDAGWYLLVALILTGSGIMEWIKKRKVLVDRIMGSVLLVISSGIVLRSVGLV